MEYCTCFLVAAVGETVHKLLVVQAFRPDRMLAAANQFVSAALGASFMHDAEQELDLYSVIENEVKTMWLSYSQIINYH